jgi:molybdenum cofactor guanylyltransferase
MCRAGYVLTGGGSKRMGRDKALLPYGSGTLVEHVAGQVLGAAGSVTLVGNPSAYRHLGYPVLADAHAGCGPLGGIATALAATAAGWNLVIACDMPNVTEDLLRTLLAEAESAGEIDCLVPELPSGLEPLCAAYHRRCLAKLRAALESNILKMRDIIDRLDARRWRSDGSQWFRNVNTPEDWARDE